MPLHTGQEVLASVTLRKDLPDHYRFEVQACLVHLRGNERPYFSVTGELHNLRRKGDNAIESCGHMSEEVLKHFPSLAPVVALHLADDDGVPMYAVENGAYWLGFTQHKEGQVRKTPNGGLETVTLPYMPYFQNLWRISAEEARQAYYFARSQDDPRAALMVLAWAMAPRWKADAIQALNIIKTASAT